MTMKKIAVFVLALLCVVALVGCSKKGEILLKEGAVKSVSVNFDLPGYPYFFVGEDAKAIVNCLSGLELTPDSGKTPRELNGGGWVIDIEYEDGQVVTLTHLERYIHAKADDSWYKIEKDQANAFDHLLSELAGRPAYTKGGTLFQAGTVRHISVSSLPEGYDYSYTGRKAQAIADYLVGLDLVEDSAPPPPGGVWNITLEYEDGSTVKLYHSANEYIGISGGLQYRMTYEQASAFDSLLWELNENK